MEIDFDKLLVSPFVTKIDAGLATVAGGVLIFATILALIDFTLTMIRTIENRDQLITAMFERMLKYAFWFGIITNYIKIKEILLDTFVSFASLFTDGKIDTATIIGDVYNSNMANINKILDAANTMTGFGNVGWKILYYLCWILAFVLLIWILVSIIFAVIAFHFVIGIAIIFICFTTFDGTTSLGEKFVTAVVGAGMNLSVILIIQALSSNVMKDYLFPSDAVSDAVNKPQLIFGWIAIYSVCGYFITKASSLSAIITSGAGEGLSATGLGRAMISQVSAVVAVTGAVVTAGAAGAGAVAGASAGAVGATGGATVSGTMNAGTASSTVSSAMNAGNTTTVSATVKGTKTVTATANSGQKAQATVKGTKGAWEGAKEGFRKGKKFGNKTKAVLNEVERHTKTVIKLATGEDDKALLKGAVDNTTNATKNVVEYTEQNIDNTIDEKNRNKGKQDIYTSIMKGNIKTFKESKTGKKVFKTAEIFKNNYQKIKDTSNKAIENVKKTIKWTNKKTQDSKESMKKTFKNIYSILRKRKYSSNFWNRNKKNKDSWE